MLGTSLRGFIWRMHRSSSVYAIFLVQTPRQNGIRICTRMRPGCSPLTHGPAFIPGTDGGRATPRRMPRTSLAPLWGGMSRWRRLRRRSAQASYVSRAVHPPRRAASAAAGGQRSRLRPGTGIWRSPNGLPRRAACLVPTSPTSVRMPPKHRGGPFAAAHRTSSRLRDGRGRTRTGALVSTIAI